MIPQNDYTTPDSLKRSMVRLADTVRTIHVIGYRIRTGLSSDQFPDPVLRDYDIIGSTHRTHSNRDNTMNIVDKRLKRLHIEHPMGRKDKFVAMDYIMNRGKARKRRDAHIYSLLSSVHTPWNLR